MTGRSGRRCLISPSNSSPSIPGMLTSRTAARERLSRMRFRASSPLEADRHSIPRFCKAPRTTAWTWTSSSATTTSGVPTAACGDGAAAAGVSIRGKRKTQPHDDLFGLPSIDQKLHRACLHLAVQREQIFAAAQKSQGCPGEAVKSGWSHGEFIVSGRT